MTSPDELLPTDAPRGKARSRVAAWWKSLCLANEVRDPAPTPWRERVASSKAFLREPGRALQLLLFLACVAWLVWNVSVYWEAVIDDAFISFRFAENFANGHGFVFNVGGERVEGYSNCLWVLMCAIPIKLGWDVLFFAKAAGLFCAIATLAVAWAFSLRLRGRDDAWNLLAPAFLAVNASFAHWAVMGLETPLSTLLIVLTYHRFFREMTEPHRRLVSPWLATLAAMTRIDALLFLSPLAVFGALRALGFGVSFRRMFTWGLIAALSFGTYFGWRMIYFQELLPNTYYAKQCLVEIQADRVQGPAQLQRFFLDQYSPPAPPKVAPRVERIPAPSGTDGILRVLEPSRFEGALDRLWWGVQGGRSASLWWMNWWFVSTLVVLGFPRARGVILLLGPIALTVYFVIHVDGDWMPNYRFFQHILPFLAVLGPVALGIAQDHLQGTMRAMRVPACALAIAALAGIAVEQSRIGYVYIFGDAPSFIDRERGWWRIDSVMRGYRKGFVEPLAEVSQWLLLNTQDGATIYMSDIGQPGWFATHLDILDGAGLCDRRLGHAPSQFRDMPSVQSRYERFLEARGWSAPSPADRALAMREAQRLNYDAHVDSNARYVLDTRRPEYMLYFVTAKDGDPETPGWVYPQIAAKMWADPVYKSAYEFAFRLLKIEGVSNQFYRRKDVPESVPDAIKAARLIRTMERNPRLYEIVAFAYRSALAMDDLASQRRVVDAVRARIPRAVRNPRAAASLLSIADLGGDLEMRAMILEQWHVVDPNSTLLLRMESGIAWKEARTDEAISMILARLDRDDPAMLDLMIGTVFYLEYERRCREAVELAAESVVRHPDSEEAWRALAMISHRVYRSSANALSDADRVFALRAALSGYEGLRRFETARGTTTSLAAVEEMRREVRALSVQLLPREPKINRGEEQQTHRA